MKPFAIAALGTGLAVASFGSKAADLVLCDATGRPVAVLVQNAVPIDVFAQQDAMLDRMMQTMRHISAGEALMDEAGLGALQPGSTVITTSFSDGTTSCSRTVTVDQRGGGAPVVQVRQTGNGCDAPQATPRGNSVPVALPRHDMQEPVVRPTSPNGPELIRVDYRHPAVKQRPHRG